MKLLIDIDDKTYKMIKDAIYFSSGGRGSARVMEYNALKAIYDGKPLKTDVLSKIREEILEEKECAYDDFERYKVEYLGQDWEDALDSLPQDDFRYGMERAVEIIDKYKTEG